MKTTTEVHNKQYGLEFLVNAQNEYQALDSSVRAQLGKKLAKRLSHPHVPKDKLRGLEGAYKIKLLSAGIRLVYLVLDDELVVLVITVGARSDNDVYKQARKILNQFMLDKNNNA